MRGARPPRRPGGLAGPLRRAGLLAACTALFLLGLPDWSAGGGTGLPVAEAQGKRGRPGGPKPAPRPAPRRPGNQSPAPKKPESKPPAGPEKERVFDFTGLDISGQLRAPQLMYFLDRATEELERAALERRSFLPEMARALDEEAL
jgi:hypothetical protein